MKHINKYAILHEPSGQLMGYERTSDFDYFDNCSVIDYELVTTREEPLLFESKKKVQEVIDKICHSKSLYSSVIFCSSEFKLEDLKIVQLSIKIKQVEN